MSTPRHALRFALLILAALAGCAGPPGSAYLSSARRVGEGIDLGRDASGEACQLQPVRDGGDVFCGTWEQPSGRIRRGPATTDLAAAATASVWRNALDARMVCDAPTLSTILGDVPAAALLCTRRTGGWPQAALVAHTLDATWYADAILPALPVLGRGIGVLSGRVPASAAVSAPPGRADALAAGRLAAQAFGAGDVGLYDDLMRAGSQANLSESFSEAERAFRAAAGLQRKALGRDNPNAADAVMHLALQVSDQGRYAEADGLFAEAARLAPHAADALAPVRLMHYRALHDANQRRWAEALGLLRQAEAGYAGQLPPEMLTAGARPPRRPVVTTGAGPSLAAQSTLLDPAQRAALIGVIEARRYQAIALRELGRPGESAAAIRSAAALSAARGLRQPSLTARLYRTAASTAGAAGESAAALTGLSRSTFDFGQAQPGSRPLAQTEMLRAGELVRQGRDAEALEHCRHGATLLRELRAGTRPEFLQPCLEAYARRAGSGDQALLAEMFEAAQLAQGGVTSQQIAAATARMAEGARDPRVGEAIRRQQDAAARVAALDRQRDLITLRGGTEQPVLEELPTAEELERRRAEAGAELADADAALQVASPNYGQLVQQVVPAADVLHALAPGEAFVSVVLSDSGGWVFALRDGQLAAARSPADAGRMAELVQRVRAGLRRDGSGLPRFDAEAARRIYDETLGLVQARLEGVRTLVVAPTGPLLALPFSVLLTGPSEPSDFAHAPWLIRQTAVAHVPSAVNFVALRRVARSSRAGRPWLGLGDFRPVLPAQAARTFSRPGCEDSARLFAGLAPLPFARPELEAARHLLGGGASDTLLGASYTAEAVRRAPLGQYRVLHFASHALLPSELRCQSNPAVVTSAPPGAADASGALLSAAGVSDLKLDADLVILSACNSAGPEGPAGESLSGLARAFLFAGTRGMLVTHWSVNDQVAAFLVADTLRRMKDSEAGGAAGALRAAQLGLLDDAGRELPAAVAHPYFWAPFALVGDGRGRVVAAGS